MVEDHPIEYGKLRRATFPKAITAPAASCCGIEGTYEVLDETPPDQQLTRGDFKFRLSGKKLSGDFAIVRTKRGKGNEWLLLKKKDAFAQPGWDPEDHARSVVSGRTQEEIAQDIPAHQPAARVSP